MRYKDNSTAPSQERKAVFVKNRPEPSVGVSKPNRSLPPSQSQMKPTKHLETSVRGMKRQPPGEYVAPAEQGD